MPYSAMVRKVETRNPYPRPDRHQKLFSSSEW